MRYYFFLEVLLLLLVLGQLLSRKVDWHLKLPLLVSLASVTLLFIGPWAWNRIRGNVPFGLLGFLTLEEDQLLVLHSAILPLSFSLYLGFMVYKAFEIRRGGESISTEALKVFDSGFSRGKILILGILNLFMYVLGQGPSIWNRNSYLSSDGISILERVTNATNLPVSFLVAYYSIFEKKRNLRYTFRFLLLCYFLLILSKGSRLSILIVLFVIFINLILKSKNIFIRLASAIVGLLFALITFEVSILSRSVEHGFFRLPEIYLLALSEQSFTLDKVVSIVIGSLLSVVVVIPRSTDVSSTSLIFKNLNPFFGTSNDPYSFSLDGTERLWPYRWVPLSSAGQIYGLFGPILVFTIFFIATIVLLFASSRILQSKLGIPLLVILNAGFLAQILFYLQYSSRIWIRSFQVFLFLALLSILFSYRKTVPTNRHFFVQSDKGKSNYTIFEDQISPTVQKTRITRS